MKENILVFLAKIFWEKIETQDDCAETGFVWRTIWYKFKDRIYITTIKRMKK